MLSAGSAAAQGVVACDFDIGDNLGKLMTGSTIHLVGRAGAGAKDPGTFVIVNGNTQEMDIDFDGWALGCDYNNLTAPLSARQNLVNVDDPSLGISAQNIVISNLGRQLLSGGKQEVQVTVEIPVGTPAGIYVGFFEIRDSLIQPVGSTNREFLNLDRVYVEITVESTPGLTIVSPDSAVRLDSVVVRARAGSIGSSVMRIANTGNAPLTDVRLSASDLRSESAVGLVIPGQNVSFSIPGFSGLGVRDTARVVVSVRVPRGILGGRYRGSIFVQGADVLRQEIPLIVIVTSARGILFANNPVRGTINGVADIAFNGDPGTQFQVGIFDMSGLMVYTQGGSVFAGVGGTGTVPTAGADFAAVVTWPLINGRGESVASGMYLVVVESIVNGQRQLARDRLMVIR
jgi:hypothetical protein